MSIPYFPGCTLHVKAKDLDDSTRAALAALGLELTELPEWTCCGAVFPLAQDNYMGMVAAARILANAAKLGDGRLVTVCSFCYHVLKRVNFAFRNRTEARNKLNEYLEEHYNGEVTLLHPLELIRDDVGFDVLQDRVYRRLKGLKVACYYGCTLSRPAEEMGFGEPENPTIMEELVAALGAEPVGFSWKTKCCGSYQVLNNAALAADRAQAVLEAASRQGAHVIITSCPLCRYNLERLPVGAAGKGESEARLPVLYFTQLLGIALQLPATTLGLDSHYLDALKEARA
jgi:heterodisulfide reductase subunit B